MVLPKSLITVTAFSKLLALSLFVFLPLLGFYLGIQYQKSITPQFDLESWQKLQSLKQKNSLKPTPALTRSITLSGVLKRYIPQHDRDYEYELELNTPFGDSFESQVVPTVTIDKIPVVPATYVAGNIIRNNISKNITATGTIEWSYMESRYFFIEKIIETSSIKEWKSYTDPHYHFTFKYPPELKLSKGQNLFELNNKTSDEFNNQFAISIGGYIIERTGMEKIINVPTDPQVEKELYLENFNKNNNIDCKAVFMGNPPYGGYSVYIPIKNQKDKYLEVSALIHHARKAEYLNIFNQILSTFLFPQ